jgi:hypothetical protein
MLAVEWYRAPMRKRRVSGAHRRRPDISRARAGHCPLTIKSSWRLADCWRSHSRLPDASNGGVCGNRLAATTLLVGRQLTPLRGASATFTGIEDAARTVIVDHDPILDARFRLPRNTIRSQMPAQASLLVLSPVLPASPRKRCLILIDFKP